MPVTQSVEFPASTGATLTAKAYPVGSDTATQTAGSTTEATNRKGLYVATFTDLAAGTWFISALDAGGQCFFEGIAKVTLTTATFQVLDFGNVTDDNVSTVATAVAGANSEPTSPPAQSASLGSKIAWLFSLGKNKRTQTDTTETVLSDADGTTSIGGSTKSDDGTTFTRGKYS